MLHLPAALFMAPLLAVERTTSFPYSDDAARFAALREIIKKTNSVTGTTVTTSSTAYNE